MIESKFEILHVSEAVSLAFQCFDFVDQPLHRRIGDPMFEICKETSSVSHQSFGDLGQVFYAGGEGVLTP